jgi:carbon-monoxide dehydrogenase medium subunit
VSTAIAKGASINDAAAMASNEAEPQSDLNASTDYRKHLACVLVRRALEAASK